ncbi:MAG: ribosome-associated translation inhibitor RaiA [Dissulfurispiraceae bacterium]|jgi:putative sigma-54 modulation protein|nr:ribosome-associated translation inhibitor RaiA [Dissulfurispiraceae bacterium]
MNIVVSGRHIEITQALRSYSEEKIGVLDKYVANISEAQVTLSVEKKYRQKAEVLLKVNGVMIQAESISEDIYASIDEVSEKLEKQIKKYKEKMKDFRKGGDKKTARESSAGTDADSGIIKRKRFAMKPMSPEEAVDQMELMDKDFFIFSNISTGDFNVVYKRKDGNFGLIEPVK